MIDIGEGAEEILLGEIEVDTKSGKTSWLLPLGVLWEDGTNAALPSRLALARVRQHRRVGLLTDGFALTSFVAPLYPGDGS